MNIENYSAVVSHLLQSGVSFEEALTKLKAYLSHRGHLKLLPRILKHLKQNIAHEERRMRPIVYVRNKEQLLVHKKAIEAALTQLGADAEYSAIEDDSLIGGFMVTANHKQIDRTYKRKLTDLYYKVITT